MSKTVVVVMVIALVLTGFAGSAGAQRVPDIPGAVLPVPVDDLSLMAVTPDRSRSVREWEEGKIEARGVYLTGGAAGNPRKVEEILGMIRDTELNAVVIDVKDDTGRITYRSAVPLAVEVGANTNRIKDMPALLERFESEGVYTIARIVAFKDPTMARARPDMAVTRTDGSVWTDYSGKAWLDPGNRGAWDYNVDLGIEAARLGFDEIQYDYVRYPSDGKTSLITPGQYREARRSETIADFLGYAREKLRKEGVYLSADIFGLVTTAIDDMGIGQHLETLAETVDYLSPMMYPSHYGPRIYGLPDPDTEPYWTVYYGLEDALERLGTREGRAKLRPWIQDFSLKMRYGPAEVEAQIRACRDQGIDQWLLWNPGSRFTAAALKGPEER